MASLDDFRVEDGVLLDSRSRPADEQEYREQWEREAREDPVRSATARAAEGRGDYATLTAKMTQFWRRFPAGRHVGSLLEVGCGYGRIPLYLARERALTCAHYVAVDVSETMLRHLKRHRSEFAVFPGADVRLVCTSAERLPLPDASIDLALSSGVFLHMDKNAVRRALGEVARVLKPGGSFAFDTSFPNRVCPANLPGQVRGLIAWRRKPHQLRYYSRGELRRLLSSSGLAGRVEGYELQPSAYGLLPKNVGPVPVPLARRINAALSPPPPVLDRVATVYFTASSVPL